MTTISTESAAGVTRRTAEQKLAYLQLQMAKTRATIEAGDRRTLMRAWIVAGKAVTKMRDPAMIAQIKATLTDPDRLAVDAGLKLAAR